MLTAFVRFGTTQGEPGEGAGPRQPTGERTMTVTLVRQANGRFVAPRTASIPLHGQPDGHEERVESAHVAFGVGGRWDSDLGRDYGAF